MVLVDTSIWLSHFRDGNPQLRDLLLTGQVACHPFIVGELACGNIRKREEILSLLKAFTIATIADHIEVLHFIEQHRLIGIGLGYIDVHLLASALLSGMPLWTRDKKLREAAVRLNVFYK